MGGENERKKRKKKHTIEPELQEFPIVFAIVVGSLAVVTLLLFVISKCMDNSEDAENYRLLVVHKKKNF